MTWIKKKMVVKKGAPGGQVCFNQHELKTAGIQPGDFIEVTADAENKRIIIRRVE